MDAPRNLITWSSVAWCFRMWDQLLTKSCYFITENRYSIPSKQKLKNSQRKILQTKQILAQLAPVCSLNN